MPIAYCLHRSVDKHGAGSLTIWIRRRRHQSPTGMNHTGSQCRPEGHTRREAGSRRRQVFCGFWAKITENKICLWCKVFGETQHWMARKTGQRLWESAQPFCAFAPLCEAKTGYNRRDRLSYTRSNHLICCDDDESCQLSPCRRDPLISGNPAAVRGRRVATYIDNPAPAPCRIRPWPRRAVPGWYKARSPQGSASWPRPGRP